ncbi:MAG: 50S ribosomal protein L3 [Candidatus Moranbacteria bacterium]|jgi:large subunit ribosomal protein L3|nr:50S ribosomal protein L3 [Candidatus Moranbacteria bacterium]
MKLVLAKKIGMTTIFGEDGIAHNVTLLEVGKNIITGIRTAKKDGYWAVQVGRVRDKKVTQEIKVKPFNKKNFDLVCELRGEEKEVSEKKAGDILDASQFEVGSGVKIIGISKGKGYQGVMKRHNFSGSPATHGHRHDHRAPGSIGCAFPEHVLKGKKMAGRMGSDQVSVKDVKVVLIDEEKGQIAVKGPVPGNRGGIVKLMA